MSQLLALVAAVFWGVGDFVGGSTTRRLSVWTVMMWSQLIGTLVLAVGIVIVPWDEVTAADLAWGAIGGLCGVIGLGFLYTTLAMGNMAVVAPICGAASAAIPVVVDLASGNRLGTSDTVGVALALTAIVLIGVDRGGDAIRPAQIALALAAGTGFALFFVALSHTDEASGLWPVAAARVASVPVLVAVAAALGKAAPPNRDLGPVAAVGCLDMGANISIAVSLQRGSLAISSVISSLYPVVTTALAVVLHGERPKPWQWLGIAAAVGAVAVLAS